MAIVAAVGFVTVTEISWSVDGSIRRPQPTISQPLGTSRRRGRSGSGRSAPAGNRTAEAADLVTAVRDYGEPYIEHWAGWDRFSAVLETSGLRLEDDRYSLLPVVLALNGELDRARALVREGATRAEGRADAQATWYRGFAERFEARFGHARSTR